MIREPGTGISAFAYCESKIALNLAVEILTKEGLSALQGENESGKFVLATCWF